MNLTDRRVRTLATLTALTLLLVVGVVWGFSAATEPFPEKVAAPVCVDTRYAEGDPIRPAAVTVSVLNAGDNEGLAGRTIDDLVNAGFDRGGQDNAPAGTEIGGNGVQIWTDDVDNPAVLLIRSYVGGPRTQIVERDSGEPGITVVVSEAFAGVGGNGREQVLAADGTVVCSPPELT